MGSDEMKGVEAWVFSLVRDSSVDLPKFSNEFDLPRGQKVVRGPIPSNALEYVEDYFRKYEEKISTATKSELKKIMQDIVDTEIKVNEELVKLVDKEKYRLIGMIYDRL